MNVYSLFSQNALRNFNYVIPYSQNNAVLIDPSSQSYVARFLDQNWLHPTIIINTHHHFDHTQGNEFFVSNYNCKLYIPADSSIWGEDAWLEDNDIINLDEWTYLKVYYTPGHTYDHISLGLYEDNEFKALFTGDSFFNAWIGNCYAWDPEVAYNTVKNFYFHLPDNVKIYPGHDYMETNLKFDLSIEPNNQKANNLLSKLENTNPWEIVTDMETEKLINPFLRINEESVINGIINKFNLSYTPGEKEVFLKLRELRNKW